MGWMTPAQLGMTQEETDQIVNEMWERDKTPVDCNDCAAKPGEKHMEMCDVPRCMSCNDQALQCECDNYSPQLWTGIWPGVQECYELKLIARLGDTWSWDLNTFAIGVHQGKYKYKTT